MKAIKVSTSEKIVKLLMNGANIAALTGVGVIGWKLASIHKRMNKIELLDANFGKELEEYFRYADEQKKKVEELKKEIEP